MAGTYRIREIATNDDFARLRVVSIEAEGSSVNELNRAVSNRFPQSFLNQTYIPHVGNSFYEVFLRVTLRQIREIDGREKVRAEFINRRFPPRIAQNNLAGGNLLPIIVMMIDFQPGDEFLDNDIEFISDILAWGPNKVFVTPLIRFDDAIDDTHRINIYRDFVTRLIQAKNQISERIRVAASIPSFYHRSRINEIFDLYSDEDDPPSMVLLDFSRERVTSPKIIGKINRIQAHFSSDRNPNFFIYGFNVKPHRRGAENPDAEDVGCYLVGLNTIGNVYRINNISRTFIPPILDWNDLPHVFVTQTYKYTKLGERTIRDQLTNWERENNVDIPVREAPESRYSRIISAFNLDKVGSEAKSLSRLVRERDRNSIRERLVNKDIARALHH